MNKVILLGNLTRDVELRHLPSGSAIAGFGIAMNRKWRDQSGDLKEEVVFVDLEAFGKTAENIAKFFSKGSRILVEGRLKLDQWEDKHTGEKRSKLKVVVESFEFVDSRKTDDSPAGFGKPPKAARAAPAEEGDIPF